MELGRAAEEDSGIEVDEASRTVGDPSLFSGVLSEEASGEAVL